MKVFIAVMVFMMMAVSYAEELEQTECPAISNNKEKIIKTISSSSATRISSTAQ